MGATIEACMDDENEARRFYLQTQRFTPERPIHDGLLFHKSPAREKQLQHFFDTHGTQEDDDDLTSYRSSVFDNNESQANNSSDAIIEAYRMLNDDEETESIHSVLFFEEASLFYPNDAIRTKKGHVFHYSDAQQ